MPSLFSRARTQSTPKTPKKSNTLPDAPYDEFGRVTSRGSAYGRAATPSQSRKEKSKQDKLRARTISSPNDRHAGGASDNGHDLLSDIPDGSFLPLNLERPRNTDTGEERPKEHDYGYLSYERHVVLGLEEVARLVDVVAAELGARGLTTPFVFSALALDVSAAGIRRLIKAFLRTCASPSAEAERAWRDEARFASPHELGMCLRWGLARVVRVVGGQDYRGLIDWGHYVEFRDSERALNFPPSHFQTFLPPLDPLLRSILVALLSVLTRLTAHSASSGHTPPTLSPLFGPLLFGLGPPTLAFHHAYHYYLRSATATEHLLLSFIRAQDTSASVPTRLKDWIRGYPAMLPDPSVAPKTRRGARTVPLSTVRRNVRMYSPDLVRTGASWGGGLAESREWGRIAPPGLPPRYSENYKKRMDLPSSFNPDTGASGISVSSSLSSTTDRESESDYFGANKKKDGDDRFRSLTDLKWGEFEELGFAGIGDEKKLQFDLTESARSARAAKRQTLSWNDFSNAGFSRGDDPLAATLQFSTPITHTIAAWPNDNAALARKLKKTHRALPAFGWDTSPVMGQEEIVEEAFVDVFCDLIYGGGWMDLERGEEIDRECNWALVEFKSLPVKSSATPPAPSADPRTSSTLILFEEFVPAEYRAKLAVPPSARKRLPTLFSGSKTWKPAQTLNGRPYQPGQFPRSPSAREMEFEGLLYGNKSATKVISLGGAKGNGNAPPPTATPAIAGVSAARAGAATLSPRKGLNLNMSSKGAGAEPPLSPARAESPKKGSRFRIPVPGGTAGPRKSGLSPAEYSTVDFETRETSYSDEDLADGGQGDGMTGKADKRRSKDDAWVDILVATHTRRMDSQAATMRQRGRSDPELASQEVAQVLAGIRARSPDSEEDGGMEAVSVKSAVQKEPPESAHEPEPPVQEESRDVTQVDEEDPDIDSIVSYPRATKRVGYFDLHPERRPVSRLTATDAADDDPREILSAHDSDEDDSLYAPPAPPPKAEEGLGRDYDSKLSPLSPLDVPEYADTGRGHLEREHSKQDSMTLPPGSIPVPPLETSTPKKPAGKTAALIEMYRQRESGASAPTGSRLPVRTEPPTQIRPLPTPTPAPAPALAPAPPPQPPVEPAFIEPPRPPVVLDPGRASPARYVHGAPLHNVLEEEESE